ncbi:hypothetical protein [Tritonibacter sp. SIMBA_163]|uniref:hypothetical protein n=1 Tax=Tritonibacter sp. SIMBA_163 TaxID=3080868 RepID=UPI00398010F6
MDWFVSGWQTFGHLTAFTVLTIGIWRSFALPDCARALKLQLCKALCVWLALDNTYLVPASSDALPNVLIGRAQWSSRVA